MTLYEHNDFEILYSIREGNEEALELMFRKYKALIAKKIYKYNLVYDYDDMFQEAYMILYKSITHFDDEFKKSFTRYFEMNLERRFMTIVTKRRRRGDIFNNNELYIYENNHNIYSNGVYYELYLKEIEKILTKQEFIVYTLRELKNFSVSYISAKVAFDEKQVYNMVYRAKAKIKAHFNN